MYTFIEGKPKIVSPWSEVLLLEVDPEEEEPVGEGEVEPVFDEPELEPDEDPPPPADVLLVKFA